ncbi:MAG: hypothetical protein P4L83_22230 [Nevskia sp.]|nr:hypothetical protein [Nevskia sp.]
MAIDLPPPLEPQLAPIEEVRAQSGREVTIEYRGVRIHLSGPAVDSGAVDSARLRRDVAAAETPSDAVRTIGYLYYVSAYPAELTRYAVAGPQDLYVRVVPGRVERVDGPARLLPYFSGLSGRTLRCADLEDARILAGGVAERAGEKYSPAFRSIGGDRVVLDLGAPAAGGKQMAAAGEFSNYGNRYAGPYLADAALRGSFGSGDELTLAGASSVRLLGLGGAHSEPYHEGDAGWSRVTRFGVFGVDGRYADFHQAVPIGTLDGSFTTGAASWLYPVYADFRQRYNLEARLDRSHQSVDANLAAGRAEILSEQYNSFELSLSYTGRWQSEGRRMELQAAATLRKGLGPTASPGTPANLAYFVWRPSFEARYGLGPHWTALAAGNFQIGGSVVPQLEQFVVGGPDSAHAYESGAGVGDHGENLRLGAEWKGANDSWYERHGLRPRLFAEYAAASLARRNSLGENAGGVEVADIGAEAPLKFTSWLAGTLSLAQSVYDHGRQQSPDGLARKYVFFKLAAKY